MEQLAPIGIPKFAVVPEAGPTPVGQAPAAAKADRLHSGENIADDELTPDLLQIKKIRKYIRENPVEIVPWRWPNEYIGLTNDEIYDKIASTPRMMEMITGSNSPISEYSTATNFRGSLTHSTPSNYSSSPASRAGISERNKEERRSAIMAIEAENYQPSRWTPNGIIPNTRPFAISKTSRNMLGLPAFKKAAKWSSSTRSGLSDSELKELLAGKTEDARYFELAKRGVPHEEIVELFSYGPPAPFKRSTYFKSLGLGGKRKVSRKNRKSTRRVKRRSTRRN